jgi:hypothetical protein
MMSAALASPQAAADCSSQAVSISPDEAAASLLAAVLAASLLATSFLVLLRLGGRRIR